MSFSSDVKQELLGRYDTSRHCSIAELASLINITSEFGYENDNSNFIHFHSENTKVIEKIFTILDKLFNIEKNGFTYNANDFRIENKPLVKKILQTTGMLDESGARKCMNKLVVSSDCCKRAYIRGCFICSGSLCNPEKNYHLEFVIRDKGIADGLVKIINSFGADAKVVSRKSAFVVYIKESEQIVDMLNVMSAYKSFFKLEDLRVLKEVRNNINRRVNCETANLGKVVNASVKQIECINLIEEKKGIDKLAEPLIQTARLRLENPDASLKELGELHIPPIGKSGINHRLKKIMEIAQTLKEDNEDVRE